ncbi:MAG TPA: hypothetical protein PKY10_16485, partial [Lentisphaeria bacterium]|nr:hypothetical protein [Lentisphaeria bacterium]
MGKRLGNPNTISPNCVLATDRVAVRPGFREKIASGQSLILKKAVEFWAWIGLRLCVALSGL